MNEMMNYGNNNNATNGNFDMQQLVNITGQTAMNVNNMSKQMGIIASTVDTIRTDVGTLTIRMDNLELNEEITTEQSERIRELAEKRIVEILGNDPLERQKYFKIFIGKLYSDAKKNAGLGSKIDRTKKREYQRVIDYIEAWIPSCGCASLRAKADANAKARLEAKKLGYVA